MCPLIRADIQPTVTAQGSEHSGLVLMLCEEAT